MALYAKMKGPVDYTVVGSPTITDGVISDFTYDNYFKTAESISTTGISSFEFYSRVKTPSAFAEGWCRICNAGSFGNQGTTVGIWSNSSVTQSFFHLFGIDIYQQLLTTDTWYRIQYLYSPSSYTATVYDDNGNVLKSYTYSNPKLNLQGVIDFCQRYSNYVLGAIDLNNTYIKVNGQLWFGNGFDRVKIRTAPYVRYNVVGTPTITDGVVSNFSGTDYAITSDNFNPGNNTFEYGIKFTTGSTITLPNGNYEQNIFRNFVGDSGICINIDYTGWLHARFIGISEQVVYQISANTTYIVRGGYDGSNFWAILYDENMNVLAQTTGHSGSFSQNGQISIGVSSYQGTNINRRFFYGSIDLNVSYIKIDGQYWWRGDMQNVETYTLRLGD